jgi:carnitine O-acetyltransferase
MLRPAIVRSMSRLAWKSKAPTPPQGSITFAGQATLPSLPVPELNTTLSRLKDSLRPIAWTDVEYANAVSKIETFEKSHESRELQERLLRHAGGKRHWLEEWWDDTAYLGYRDSVVVNVSYFCTSPNPHPHFISTISFQMALTPTRPTSRRPPHIVRLLLHGQPWSIVSNSDAAS